MNNNNTFEGLMKSNRDFEEEMPSTEEFNQNLVHFRDAVKSRPSQKLQNDIEMAIYMRDILL